MLSESEMNVDVILGLIIWRAPMWRLAAVIRGCGVGRRGLGPGSRSGLVVGVERPEVGVSGKDWNGEEESEVRRSLGGGEGEEAGEEARSVVLLVASSLLRFIGLSVQDKRGKNLLSVATVYVSDFLALLGIGLSVSTKDLAMASAISISSWCANTPSATASEYTLSTIRDAVVFEFVVEFEFVINFVLKSECAVITVSVFVPTMTCKLRLCIANLLSTVFVKRLRWSIECRVNLPKRFLINSNASFLTFSILSVVAVH